MCFGGSKTEVVVPQPPAPTSTEIRRRRVQDALFEQQLKDAGLQIVDSGGGFKEQVDDALERDDLSDATRTQLENIKNKNYVIESIGGADRSAFQEAGITTEPGDEGELRIEAIPERTTEEIAAAVESGELTQDQADQITEKQEAAAKEEDFQKRIREKIESELFSEGPSDETRELVGETFDFTRERGEEDINQFATQLAGSRGFEKTDSPIADAAFRAQGDLTLGLRSAEAGSLLNIDQNQQLFAASLLDFQQSLRQQGVNNRANLLGFAGAATAQSGNLRASLFRPQTVGTTTQGFPLGQIAQGAGSAIGGLAAGGFFSSKQFKDDIEAFDTADYQQVLDSLEQTPVYRWTYKPEFEDNRRHIGPITEQAPKEIVTEDGMAVVPIDYLGFMMAALKGLQEKVNKMEAKNA